MFQRNELNWNRGKVWTMRYLFANENTNQIQKHVRLLLIKIKNSHRANIIYHLYVATYLLIIHQNLCEVIWHCSNLAMLSEGAVLTSMLPKTLRLDNFNKKCPPLLRIKIFCCPPTVELQEGLLLFWKDWRFDRLLHLPSD